MSSEEIDKGMRWGSSIAEELQTCNFGIICLTPQNLEAPWIHFEAGALSKVVEQARVAPILFDLKPSDVQGPLAQFQLTTFEKDEMNRLIGSINSACGSDSLEQGRLDRAFSALWPQLKTSIDGFMSSADTPSAERSRVDVPSVLEEILVLARQHSQSISMIEATRHAIERLAKENERLMMMLQDRRLGRDSRTLRHILHLWQRVYLKLRERISALVQDNEAEVEWVEFQRELTDFDEMISLYIERARRGDFVPDALPRGIRQSLYRTSATETTAISHDPKDPESRV